ncbi:MAG: 4'-phosphopantetheinyl transferase superfamily protein [Coleofasciculaceae cyanobacterium]
MFSNNIFGLPPLDLKLLENEVHVWSASFKQLLLQVEQLTQILSEDEKNRASRFHFEQDKTRFIIGRGLLRLILGRYLKTEPDQLQFAYSLTGKPVVSSSNVQFNLSHSEEMILYAFTSDRQIGIDLEYLRPIPELKQLIQQFFSIGEASAILSLPASEQQLAFLQTWTCKEAYLKATGEGLAQLSQVEVYIKPGEPYRLLNNQSQANRWSLQTLTLTPEYVAALVVEGQNWHLKCWQWS